VTVERWVIKDVCGVFLCRAVACMAYIV